MTGIGYQKVVRFSQLVGPWFFTITARIIAAMFFCIPSRTRESIRFYKALFPEKTSLYHRVCTFRQFQNFTTIHFDRMLLNMQPESISYTSEGLEHLQHINRKTGAIILQSHLGNWDIAAHLLQQQELDVDLLLYMGIKGKEQVESLQKEQLRGSGIRIIGVDQNSSSPFDAVEGINHLRDGGVVSMTGDLLWNPDQRSVEVDFLRYKAHIPVAPYIFAIMSGAPLLPFFTFRTGPNKYHFTLAEPVVIRETSRENRQQSIAQAAQNYADLLEQTLRKHPFEWYHFDRFIL